MYTAENLADLVNHSAVSLYYALSVATVSSVAGIQRLENIVNPVESHHEIQCAGCRFYMCWIFIVKRQCDVSVSTQFSSFVKNKADFILNLTLELTKCRYIFKIPAFRLIPAVRSTFLFYPQ